MEAVLELKADPTVLVFIGGQVDYGRAWNESGLGKDK
jgi:hypothetical protein